MKIPEPEPGEERPLAWNAILGNTPVYESNGQEVGVVYEVLGAEDVFHGVVVRSGPLAHLVMIPADQVSRITNRRIDLTLSADEIRALPQYKEEESYQLGFVGFLRRHLGWVAEHDDGGPQ